MERFYLVQEIATATAQNPCHKGEVHTYLFGKADEILFADGDPDGCMNKNILCLFFLREYGYKRKCDAARNWVYRHPDRPGECVNWHNQVSIVQAIVHDSGAVEIVP